MTRRCAAPVVHRPSDDLLRRLVVPSRLGRNGCKRDLICDPGSGKLQFDPRRDRLRVQLNRFAGRKSPESPFLRTPWDHIEDRGIDTPHPREQVEKIDVHWASLES
jgi:hypothetical protein